MMKRYVLVAVAFMSTLLALVVLWQFRIAVVYVLISLTLAAVLRPLFSRLARTRTVCAYCLDITILGSSGAVLSSSSS